MSFRGNSYGKYLCKDDMGIRLSHIAQIDSSIPVVKHTIQPYHISNEGEMIEHDQ
jgi:hypothetical protein